MRNRGNSWRNSTTRVLSGCSSSSVSYTHLTESEPSEWDDSDRELVQLCLDVVSEEDFTLFRRVTLDGWAYVDAAKAAGISLWACYKRVERTQKKLRRAIEEHPERFF
mgnify:CR=1 FL=1